MSSIHSRRRYLAPVIAALGALVIAVLVASFLARPSRGVTRDPTTMDTPPHYWLVPPPGTPVSPETGLGYGAPPAARPKPREDRSQP